MGLAMSLTFGSASAAWAAETITMENCGAYLFEWRPVDCGNGRAFAILVGGNNIQESNVILNRGYDYAYTVNALVYGRPWGTVPDLVNIDGIWGIPENEALLPEGAQPYTRIVLYTNNKNLDSKERYVDVVHLPDGVNTAELPADVRKYLISVDGSDVGAYDGTITSGWWEEGGVKKYRGVDGNFITNSWVQVSDVSYYLDENGEMLRDTITPDGIYVNSNGEKTSYIPGWAEVDGKWRYIQKNGYYAANGWLKDTDGRYYYFNLACDMLVDTTTPDGYYVGADGAWDGNPSTIAADSVNLGPGGSAEEEYSGWLQVDGIWKYRDTNGEYTVNDWRQSADGGWYYLDGSGNMAVSQTTPDGYYVDETGLWNDAVAAEDTAEAAEGTEEAE